MIEKIRQGIESSEFFCGITPQTLNKLSAIGIIRKFDQNQVIFFQEEDAQGFYLILSGSVKIFRTGKDGREQIMHIFDAGKVFGEVPMFQGSKFPASASSVSKCETVYFSKKAFYSMARKDPEVLMNMLAVMSMRLRTFVDLVDDLSLKDVTARLARYILENSEDRNAFYIKESKTELAAKIGTISATLSRTFKKLQKAGAVKVSSSLIEIISREKLEEIIET